MKIAKLEQNSGKIFGILSPNHNRDVCEILKIIKSLKRGKNER